ncbi:LytTR family DNA-binding domain-containing protein [Zobellia galactanivorans]|uniref:LytR/AlgR family response regulator transcription factor n=1 Tax=Zobellia TaxID=112040 RepID=UPI000B52F424|nr:MULTISPECIES: LytTR family DNA-binding domain-containing protein [Zobellia]MDO6810616.1 LytTR family DNA-binding domain-containing protein [Zobellia galactanivorans]OWW23166.1 DNA-binding response regulator [Zobellia sp. OII3]
MIKAIIVEDEFNALNTLDKLIRYTQKDIEVVAKIDNVQEAIAFLKKRTPDLVFLDIELIDGNAFQILEALDSIAFKIIFITAYDEFAIKAIKFDTIDYILKPIDSDELSACLDRFRVAYEKDRVYKNALDKVAKINEREVQKTLLIKTADAQYFLQIKDIVRCQSDGAYTVFHTVDKKIMSARNLKYYENILSEHTFVRVHQSHLVNIKYIKTISGNNSVWLTNDEEIPVATRKKSYLKQVLDSL